jgi:hypothetical protein
MPCDGATLTGSGGWDWVVAEPAFAHWGACRLKIVSMTSVPVVRTGLRGCLETSW